MFTGLVQEVGRVAAIARSGGNLKLTIESRDVSSDLIAGGSVCVNGVCLTVIKPGNRFRVEVGEETLSRTNLLTLRAGSKVNLETPMKPSSTFGGHIVTGHVDTTARIEAIKRLAGSQVWRIGTPESVGRFIVEKGSICVDGISLTVASVEPKSFTVSLIPHTLESTTLKSKRAGDRVNLEADILAKHIEKLIHSSKETTLK